MNFDSSCDVCHAGITEPRDGMLWIDMGTIPPVDDERTPFASWRVSHIECIGDDDFVGVMYSIDLNQAVDPRRFMHWVAHLWGKPWLPRTNWESFLRQISERGRMESVPRVEGAVRSGPGLDVGGELRW